MYWIALVVVVLFLSLTLLAGGEEVPQNVEGMLRPFWKCGSYLYRRLGSLVPGLFRGRVVTEDLSKLNPGEPVEALQREYYVKKLALCLVVAVVGSLVGTGAKWSAESSVLLKEGVLFRREYSEGEQEILLGAEYAGETYEMSVEIPVRRLTEQETEEMFEEMLREMPDLILGDNESLQQVCVDLNLADSYGMYPATVEWKSDKPNVVSRSGKVRCQGEEQAVLTVTLTYGEFSREEKIAIRVMPPELSEEERYYQGIRQVLEASEENTAWQREWKLPEMWEGKGIVWMQIVEDNSLAVGGVTLVTVLLIYVLADRDLHEKAEKRKNRLRRDYPEVVHKLVLFVGAGMTIRGAFYRIASDSGGDSPAYEEMNFTCRELNSGVSESIAYEHFGKRCGLQEYIRLSTLLVQNLKRGNAALMDRLREEADRAAEDKLQQSKKLGEEASTKLLLPMVMMLAVVMVIIMAPAFSAI